MSTIVGSTANVAQTVSFNAIGCSVSSSVPGTYLVAFGPQTANPNPVEMPQPSNLGSALAFNSTTTTNVVLGVLASSSTSVQITGVSTSGYPTTITVTSTAGMVMGAACVQIAGVNGATSINGIWTVLEPTSGGFLDATHFVIAARNASTWTGGGAVSFQYVGAPQLAPSLAQGAAALPAGFSIALSAAAKSAGVDAKSAAYLGWVAWWDYIRQGGT